MNRDLLQILACPADKHSPLEIRAERTDGERIESGEIHCPKCGANYPVDRGIPCFLDAGRTIAIDQRQELQAREQEYQAGVPAELDDWRAIELDAFRSCAGDCSGLRVLDVGCGIGQMTAIARKARQVVGLDFARQALDRFNGGGYLALNLIQGDCLGLPFGAETFDLAISSQVVEHAQFWRELAGVLAPGGRAIVSAYNWCESYRQEGLPKEGYHNSGIFYHRYDAEDLMDEASTSFDVQRLMGVRSMVPGVFRLMKVLGPKLVYWDRFWRSTRLSLKYGAYLMVVGAPRGSHGPHARSC